ncbi:unannotated protein [freshwater metagenome]|uniref:Unannotated protein n=1 Tax=freshwater metagenome TaxID=449393 RepID=A0A6J7EF22_9ZZZZ
MILGPTTVFSDPLIVTLKACGDLFGVIKLFFSEQACLNALGQGHFLFSIKQRNLADQFEVVLDWVSRSASDLNGLHRFIGLVLAREHETVIICVLDFALGFLQFFNIAAFSLYGFDHGLGGNGQRFNDDSFEFRVFKVLRIKIAGHI